MDPQLVNEEAMVLMFPDIITTYYVADPTQMPAHIRKMEVGDTNKMLWDINDGKKYITTCIKKDGKKDCEELVDKIEAKLLHPCELDIKPGFISDHCRMCRKPIKGGKIAVLVHQAEVHTGGDTCPILDCCHTFQDVWRIKGHLRRHVEQDERGKLETDDEGIDEEQRREREEEIERQHKKIDLLDENGNLIAKIPRNASRVEKRKKTITERPTHECMFCPRVFKYKKSLQKHIDQHDFGSCEVEL